MSWVNGPNGPEYRGALGAVLGLLWRALANAGAAMERRRP